MKVIRSLAAVVAGCAVTFTILRALAPTPTDSPSMNYFLLSIAWTVAGAIAGGFVTAWIARAHEMPHAAALQDCYASYASCI